MWEAVWGPVVACPAAALDATPAPVAAGVTAELGALAATDGVLALATGVEGAGVLTRTVTTRVRTRVRTITPRRAATAARLGGGATRLVGVRTAAACRCAGV